MSGTKRLFLTMEQALEAVRMSFVQYPFQLHLLSTLWPLVFGECAYIQFDSHNRSVWAKIPGKDKLVLCREDDLKARIVAQLRRFPPPPEALARICTMVFGAKVCATGGKQPGLPTGVWLYTDMADFICKRCGHCCRTLDYRDGCALDDYRRWQELGRTDILQWVGTVRENGCVVACHIWMEPGTNRFAECCPWLKIDADQKSFICKIHDLRPSICRQYPGSRKHARLTGCRGV